MSPDVPQPELQEVPRRPPIRVPVDHLAQMLDRGSASVYAVRLLLEKHRHGPGYALSQPNLAKKRAEGGIGMSKRAFAAGMRVLRSGPLERGQGGRRLGGRGAFARESMAPGSSRYIAIDETMVRDQSFKLVAFVAATLLNPHPRNARAVAGRIGLRGKVSIGKLVEQALAGGRISAVKKGSGWIVGRPGVDLSGFRAGKFAVENGAVEIGAVESGATHSKQEDSHRKQKKAHSPNESPSQTAGSRDSLMGGSTTELFLGGQPAEDLVEELRIADIAGALDAHLLTPKGIEGYLALVRNHGDVARSAVRTKLAAFALDGVVPGQIWTWSYFDGCIDDEAKSNWMAESGQRPGDVFGFHRKLKLEG